jgi:hypothetical protein
MKVDVAEHLQSADESEARATLQRAKEFVEVCRSLCQ